MHQPRHPSADNARAESRYRIYFPLFDHIEAKSNEMRLLHSGLTAHPRIELVADAQAADYLVFCQNHFVSDGPLLAQFQAIKDRHKDRSVMLDFGDDPDVVLDADDFRWALYFKRSCVDRRTNQVIDYGLPVLPIAYCVPDAMVDAPEGLAEDRQIAVSCLFEDDVIDNPVFSRCRGRLLRFAKQLARDHSFATQVGTVSECGSVGRSTIARAYKQCLFNSKIVLHANPDWWEGDSRLWEAVAAGALVFVDRMCQPIADPFIDRRHVVFYDLTDDGMRELESQVLYYLSHDDDRKRIARQGRAFVMARHRAIHRVDQIVAELDRLNRRRSSRTAWIDPIVLRLRS